MRFQAWFAVLAALVAASALDAQQKIGVTVGAGGEWIEVPGSPWPRTAWAGSATLEMRSVSVPRFALIARLEYAPERAAPPTPRMLWLGGGVRYTLAASRHLSLRPSVEFEAMRLTAVDAYNALVRQLTCPTAADIACPGLPYGPDREGWLMDEGWRLGLGLRPALQVWPVEWVGFEVTPAVRWLVPVSRSLPAGNHDRYTDPLYAALGIDLVFKLGG